MQNRLNRLNATIEKLKQDKANASGRMDNIMDNLLTDYEIETIEELEKSIAENDVTITRLKNEIDIALSKLEQAIGE